MKILQVNNVYAEKSTGKITQDLHEGLLREGYESLVVFGRGPGTKGTGVIRLCPDWYGKFNSLWGRMTGITHGGCLLSTWRLQRIILREKPDVVHLQCINEHFVNIFRLIKWLNHRHIKTVVSLHAEFMYTANCGYAFDCEQWRHGCKKCPNKRKAVKSWFFDRTGRAWKRMRRAFAGFETNCIICPVSPWTEDRAKCADILKDLPMRTVYNGINTRDVFHWNRFEEKEENAVLNVTSWFCDDKQNIKGGWYLLELAKRMPEVKFYVAGKAEKGLKLPENVILLGEIYDQKELAKRYRQVKLSIIVSKKETFSMPCAESLCCGTPMVGFRAGAPEQISLPDFSQFVEHGDLDGLEQVVREWLKREDLDPEVIALRGHEAYSSETMRKAFVDVYRSVL